MASPRGPGWHSPTPAPQLLPAVPSASAHVSVCVFTHAYTHTPGYTHLGALPVPVLEALG